MDDQEVEMITAAPLFDREASVKNRNDTIRAVCLAVDRPDMSETVEMLAQAMSRHSEGHVVAGSSDWKAACTRRTVGDVG